MLREAGVTRRDKTYLWGHSAGGQFVHRLLATQPHGIFEAVGAANSGWYTLPTLDLHYPDGLGGIGLTRDDVVRLLGYPLVIFSGDQDIDGTAENFPRHDVAMIQGSNRFARARFYIDRGQAEAAKLRVPCRWSRVVVPGVAHEGMRMSAFASLRTARALIRVKVVPYHCENRAFDKWQRALPSRFPDAPARPCRNRRRQPHSPAGSGY